MAINTAHTKCWDPAGTSEGLSVYEVTQVLGTNNQDVGAVCTSKQINRWAAFKPQTNTNGNPYIAMTLAERKRDNYGFDTSALSGIKTSSISNIFANAKTNGYTWPYSARVAPYRLSDFSDINELVSGVSTERGYNKNAVCPFSATGSMQITGGSMTVECYKDTDAEIAVEDLGVFDIEEQEWEIGIFYKCGNNYGFEGTGHYLGDSSSFEEDKEVRSHEFPTTASHTLIVWGVSNGDDDNPQFVYFPNTFADFYVSGISDIMVVPRLQHPAFIWSGESESVVTSVRIYAEASNNDGDDDGTFTLTARLWYYSNEEVYTLLDTATWPQSIEGGGTASTVMELNPNATYAEEFALDSLYVDMYYTYSVGTASGTKDINCLEKTVVAHSTPTKYKLDTLDLEER